MRTVSGCGDGAPAANNLPFLLWLAVALSFALIRVWVLTVIYSRPHRTDFLTAYASARLLIAHGWAAVYDPAQLGSAVQSITGSADLQVATPLMVLMALPFTALPPRIADLIWLGILVAALVFAWRLAAPGPRSRRIALLAGAIGLFPVFFELAVGNPVLISVLAICAGWYLLTTGRPVAAGLVLVACFIKPQDVVLLPLALVFGGRARTAVTMVIGCTVVALGEGAVLGPANVLRYAVQLSHVANSPFFGLHAVAHWVPAPWRLIEQAAVIGLVVAASWRNRRLGPEIPLTVGLLGSLMVTPYLNAEDFILLIVGGWLVLHAYASTRVKVALALTWLLFQFGFFVSPPPVLAAEVLWLPWLAAYPPRSCELKPT